MNERTHLKLHSLSDVELQFIVDELKFDQQRYIAAEQRAAVLGAFAGILLPIVAERVLSDQLSQYSDVLKWCIILVVGSLFLSILCSLISIIPFNLHLSTGISFFRERSQKINSYSDAIALLDSGGILTAETAKFLIFNTKSSNVIDDRFVKHIWLRNTFVLRKAIVIRQVLAVAAASFILLAFAAMTAAVIIGLLYGTDPASQIIAKPTDAWLYSPSDHPP